MKNFIQKGDVLDLTAPSGGVVSGSAYLIGSLLVVASSDAAVGEKFAGAVEGVYELPKLSSDAMTEGQSVNWNDTNNELQAETSDLDGAAVVVEAAAALTTVVKVKLKSA